MPWNKEMMLAGALVALMLTAGLAGCIGSNSEPSAGSSDVEAQDADGTAGLEGDASPGNETTTLDYDTGNETRTLWSNGSFAPQDACFPAGCPTGNAMRTVDITDIIPPEAPVNVSVAINYTAPEFISSMNAWFNLEDASLHEVTTRYQPGEVLLEGLIMRGEQGTVEATLQLNIPTPATEPEPNHETDYTLQAKAQPEPNIVPSGLPVELPLTPGENITAQAVDEDEIAFRVYDPDDDAIAHIETDNGTATWQVPHDLSEGDYVLANTWTSDITLQADTAGTLRGLLIEVDLSDPTSYEGSGEVEWSFDTRQDPLWAGIYVQTSGQDDDDGAFLTNSWGVTTSGFETMLTLPDGGTSEGSWTCNLCIHGSAFAIFGPPMADPGLVAGTYDAYLSSEQSIEYEYGHAFATYVR